jgi:hypothetical protein
MLVAVKAWLVLQISSIRGHYRQVLRHRLWRFAIGDLGVQQRPAVPAASVCKACVLRV